MMMANNARPGANGGRPGMGIQAKGEQARDFKGTIGRLFKYVRDYQLSIVIVLLFAIASTVFMIVGPKILGQATTKLFEGVVAQIAGTGSVDFGYIGNISRHLTANDFSLNQVAPELMGPGDSQQLRPFLWRQRPAEGLAVVQGGGVFRP